MWQRFIKWWRGRSAARRHAEVVAKVDAAIDAIESTHEWQQALALREAITNGDREKISELLMQRVIERHGQVVYESVLTGDTERFNAISEAEAAMFLAEARAIKPRA
jgi:hypothetical protein